MESVICAAMGFCVVSQGHDLAATDVTCLRDELLTLLTPNSHFSNVIKFNSHGKNSVQQEEDSFHQQLGLKFKEDY
jgi:hypothetical protein